MEIQKITLTSESLEKLYLTPLFEGLAEDAIKGKFLDKFAEEWYECNKAKTVGQKAHFGNKFNKTLSEVSDEVQKQSEIRDKLDTLLYKAIQTAVLNVVSQKITEIQQKMREDFDFVKNFEAIDVKIASDVDNTVAYCGLDILEVLKTDIIEDISNIENGYFLSALFDEVDIRKEDYDDLPF